MSQNAKKAKKVKKLFVLPLQNCLMLFFMSNFEFSGKTCSENEMAIAIGGRLAMESVHALCVFLCTALFDAKLSQ